MDITAMLWEDSIATVIKAVFKHQQATLVLYMKTLNRNTTQLAHDTQASRKLTIFAKETTQNLLVERCK